MTAPSPLPENAGLAFLGEAVWPPAMLTTRQAEQFAATDNACGRPNTDVLRRRMAVVSGDPVESWQIDFPVHSTAQEAALYEQPFARVRKNSAGAWLNPHANPDLRRALARMSRFLALPTVSAAPEWRWIEDDLLPDASLLVVARDDDFSHGILASHLFNLWWQHLHDLPVLAVESFPFPWSPGRPLSSLTVTQEESRHAIARAARGGDTEQLNVAVLSAYGWSPDLAVDPLLEKLTELNRMRAGNL